MAERRSEGKPCPAGGGEYAAPNADGDVNKDCERCPFWRGTSYVTAFIAPDGQPAGGWAIVCNWPRNGSYMAPPPAPESIPTAFREAFK